MQTETPQRLRLFIALPLPDVVKTEIEKAQAQLRRALPDSAARWASREQFHLTLRFLGGVEEQRVPALTEAVREACRRFAALRMRAQGIGCFPNERLPRVVWVGVTDSRQQLPLLQSAVQSAAQDFTAEEPDDRFTGHVTLARIKKIRRSEAEALSKIAASLAQRCFGEWTANEVQIMRSQLSPQGARYSILAPIPLM